MAKRTARRCWWEVGVGVEVGGEVETEREAGDVVFEYMDDDEAGTVVAATLSSAEEEEGEEEETNKLPGLAINTTPTKLKKPAICCCRVKVSPRINKLQA